MMTPNDKNIMGIWLSGFFMGATAGVFMTLLTALLLRVIL